MADPVCRDLAGAIETGARESGARVHRGGTYICIEGPQFSTRGESNVYRRWGMSVIGMTNMPEAKLAREAELCYATMALATDYDVWHEEHDAVSVEAVVANLNKNVATARVVLGRVLPRLGGSCGVGCPSADPGGHCGAMDPRPNPARPGVHRLPIATTRSPQDAQPGGRCGR